MSTEFFCAACLGTLPIDQMIEVVGDPTCRQCFIEGIQPQFIAASEAEINYPVTYGNATLDINEFVSFFTADFLTAYNIKLQEYNIPTSDRLYCNNKIETTNTDSTISSTMCAQFLGKKDVNEEGELSSIVCSRCSDSVCTECANKITDTLDNHVCTKPTVDAFEGQTRGKDYQICPGAECHIKVSLTEACNHMACPKCRTEFCYICGVVSEPGHWSFNMPCPQYGQPGDVRHPEVIDEDEHDRIDEELRQLEWEAWIGSSAFHYVGHRQLQHYPEYVALMGAENRTEEEVEVLQAALGRAIHGTTAALLIQHLHDDQHRLQVIVERHRIYVAQSGLHVDRVHLIRAIGSMLHVYFVHVRPGLPRMQEQPQDIAAHQRIQELSAQVDEEGGFEDFGDLDLLVERHNRAWNGDVEFLIQR